MRTDSAARHTRRSQWPSLTWVAIVAALGLAGAPSVVAQSAPPFGATPPPSPGTPLQATAVPASVPLSYSMLSAATPVTAAGTPTPSLTATPSPTPLTLVPTPVPPAGLAARNIALLTPTLTLSLGSGGPLGTATPSPTATP